MIGITPKSKDGDPRVAKALDNLEIKYELDEDGDYRFGFRLSYERSQLGFIRSATYMFGDVEMREVFSLGLKSFGPFDARTTNLLLEQNSQVKVVAWQVVRDAEDNYLAIFRANISADLSGDLLAGVIFAVVTAADQMEERLSGRDDF